MVAESICNQRRMRFTELRRKVFKIVCESAEPIKAYDIVARTSDKRGSTSAMSIYRILAFLEQHGLVHKITALNAYTVCGHPSLQHNCYFLICVDCHNVEEYCDAAVDKTITNIGRKSHFQIEQANMELYGLCNSCTA